MGNYLEGVLGLMFAVLETPGESLGRLGGTLEVFGASWANIWGGVLGQPLGYWEAPGGVLERSGGGLRLVSLAFF